MTFNRPITQEEAYLLNCKFESYDTNVQNKHYFVYSTIERYNLYYIEVSCKNVSKFEAYCEINNISYMDIETVDPDLELLDSYKYTELRKKCADYYKVPHKGSDYEESRK